MDDVGRGRRQHPDAEDRRPGAEPTEPSAETVVGEGPDPEGRRLAARYATNLASFVLFVGVVAALAGVVVVVNQLTQPGGSVTVTVSDPSELFASSPEGLPDETWIDVAALDTVDLQVAELPAHLRALSELPSFVAGVLGLVAAVLLRRILVEVGRGRPFAPVVARRLAGLAVAVLALALVPQAVDSLATVVVLDHLDWRGEGSPIGFVIFQVELLAVLVAGLLGIVSRVFRHGQHLTEDAEGLI